MQSGYYIYRYDDTHYMDDSIYFYSIVDCPFTKMGELLLLAPSDRGHNCPWF